MPVLHTLKVVAALGTLSSAVWVSTFAAFSDSGEATSGSFTTGTLDLELDGGDDATLTSLALANAKPGDSVYAPLVVSNPSSTSSLTLTWSLSAVATGHTGLGAALRVGIRTGVTSCTPGGFAADGQELLPSTTTLAAAALTARPLASGASETLCVHLTLPAAVADNTLQGQTAGTTFRFTALST